MADERSGAASSDVTVEPTSLAAVLSALSLGGVRSGIKASSREGGIVLSIALSGPGEVSGKPQKVTSETPKSTPKAEKVAPKPEKSTSEAPKITPKPEKSTSGSENAAKLSEGPFPIRAATFVYFDASGKEILRVKKRRVIKSYVMTAPYHKLKDLGAKGGFFRLFGENPALSSHGSAEGSGQAIRDPDGENRGGEIRGLCPRGFGKREQQIRLRLPQAEGRELLLRMPASWALRHGVLRRSETPGCGGDYEGDPARGGQAAMSGSQTSDQGG
jgi:hypothetical protein